MNIRIEDLPISSARDMAVEAQGRGLKALSSHHYFSAETQILLGLCQMVLELRQKVQAMEAGTKLP